MRMEKWHFCFKPVVRIITPLSWALFSCTGGFGERPAVQPLRFCVLDVGQGLSQIVKTGSRAAVFDAGPRDAFEKWKSEYDRMGSPFITAMVISHDHDDHYGGIAMLDSCFNWTGLMVTSPFQDTAFLRGVISPWWRDRLRFRTVAADDTLGILDGVEIRCLWPPSVVEGIQDSSNGNFANTYSLVFSIKHGDAVALITSDIDTCAEKTLSFREKAGLCSDLFIVPHHGSGGSLDPVFYGYVHPSIAVISYGTGNSYGHPSPSVAAWLSQMGVSVRMTALDGVCAFESNGYYWRE